MNIINIETLLPEIDLIIDSGSGRDEILLNICKFLKERVYHYDWVGFYISDSSARHLTLGPFAGKPTEHKIISFGKGVCGQVAESKTTKIVQDVTREENYISCSLDVQSEIVVPVIRDGIFIAEIDIDSHSPAPFSQKDEIFLKTVAEKIIHLF